MLVGFCAALGIIAGEHSSFDSSLWTRPLRVRFEATLEVFTR